MQPLRDYQARADAARIQAHAQGHRRVLLVIPTGGGKTRCGEEAAREGRILWLAHRKELIADASTRMRESFGPLDVGVIASGVAPSPYSRVQVSSVQTLIARDVWPECDYLILDEAHHFAAKDWSELPQHYANQPHLLLTATPDRRDGKAMAGVADTLIVGATYSELLQAGHLAPCKVYQPGQVLDGQLAMDPVKAWLKFAEGKPGFCFCGSVDTCYELEHRMNEAGIRAAVIEQGTDPVKRREYIQALRDGGLDCILNVFTMTEGVDVPRAAVCMLACPADHCGNYLQKAGRVLRPHPSKDHAILIDLVGAWLLHGTPTEDRVYSLEGDPIRRADVKPRRNCLKCGAVVVASHRECPMCSTPFKFQNREREDVEILDLELQAVYAGISTPEDAKRREYARLRQVQREQGLPVDWVIKEYRKLFSETIVIRDGTPGEHKQHLAKFRAVTGKRGYNPKAAGVMFKKLFGFWPAGV